MSAAAECPICGQRAVESTDAPVTVEFRDASYDVPGFTYDVCRSCGEEFFAAGQVDAIHSVAVAMARTDQGLLTPAEIRQLRADLGLTQQGLEDVLGVGPKTVTRWEKGTVFQSAVADRFMRKIWAHPDILVPDRETANATPCLKGSYAPDCYSPAPVSTPQAVSDDFALAD
jgi:putative zinc finger/helix-turn-helix YgiT family protein